MLNAEVSAALWAQNGALAVSPTFTSTLNGLDASVAWLKSAGPLANAGLGYLDSTVTPVSEFLGDQSLAAFLGLESSGENPSGGKRNCGN